MRTLIAVAAALLAVGAASPALALPVAAGPATTSLVQLLPGTTVTTVQATKKKKPAPKKTPSESASIEEIGNAKRGKKDLEIKAKVAKSGRTCVLKIKWNGGSTSNEEAESGSDKFCEFSVDVPNDAKVVGDATAELTVQDSSGKKVASAKKTFPVK